MTFSEHYQMVEEAFDEKLKIKIAIPRELNSASLGAPSNVVWDRQKDQFFSKRRLISWRIS